MATKRLVVYKSRGTKPYFVVQSASNTLEYEIGCAIKLDDLNKLIDDGFKVDLVGRPD